MGAELPDDQRAPKQSEAVSRADADRLFDSGDYAAAEQAFEHLIAINAPESGWCLFQLGRIAVRQARWSDAISRLDAALAAANPIVWIRWEKAIALQRLGADTASVAAEMARFAQVAPEDLAAGHYAMLLRFANDAFDARCYADAAVLYDLLAARGQGGDLSLLRQADLQVHAGNPAEALRLLDRNPPHPDYNLWQDAVRARALLALRRYIDAAAVLKPLIDCAPDNVNFVRMLFTALEGGDDREALAAPDSFLHGLSAEQRFEFLLRARLHCEDFTSAARLYTEYPDSVTRAHDSFLLKAMNKAIRKLDYALVDRMFEMTDAVATGACGLVSTMLTALFAQKDWTRAASLLDSVDGLLQKTGDPELRLRKLQYFCFTLQLDKASDFAAAWSREGPLPDIASSVVAALYAARSQWHEVIALFRDRVSRKLPIANRTLLEAVARAARRTRNYAEVLELVDHSLSATAAPKLADFRARLLCETLLVNALHLPAALPDQLMSPEIDVEPYAYRASLLSNVLGGRRVSQQRLTIYFCTDKNYLVGTCVAVFSLLRNNIGLCRGLTLAVVCADDIADFAADALATIGAAFSAPITIIRSSSLVAHGSRFQTGWGLFTPGHALSEAAYFRIFMAECLLRDGGGGRALYLDSDTCVGPGVLELLELELQGCALGARTELPLKEIVYAARNLGLDPDRYFNSGVLLFDLAHPALPDALAQAIDFALHRHEALTFLDQCALNVAFQGQSLPLPDRFNAFVRENTKLPNALRQPVVWHFLDRPKPWDPLYAGPNSMVWIREFAMLGEVLAPEPLRRLLAGQF